VRARRPTIHVPRGCAPVDLMASAVHLDPPRSGRVGCGYARGPVAVDERAGDGAASSATGGATGLSLHRLGAPV